MESIIAIVVSNKAKSYKSTNQVLKIGLNYKKWNKKIRYISEIQQVKNLTTEFYAIELYAIKVVNGITEQL